MNYIKLILLGLVTFFAMLAASYARDLAYQVHALLIMVIAAGMFIWVLRGTDEPAGPAPDLTGYNDGVIRAGVIATAFWGVVGFFCFDDDFMDPFFHEVVSVEDAEWQFFAADEVSEDDVFFILEEW